MKTAHTMCKKIAAKLLLTGIPAWVLAQNVGIGEMTPGARLDIKVPAGWSSPILRVRYDTLTYFIVTQSGLVGVNTSSPVKRLHVEGDMRITNVPATASPYKLLVVNAAGDVEGIGFTGSTDSFLRADGQWAVPPTGDSVCNSVANHYLQKWTGTQLCNSQIYDSINIGIFTSNPLYPVHVRKAYGGSLGDGLLYVEDISTVAGDDAAGYFKNDLVDYWGYGVYATGGYVGVYGSGGTGTGSGVYYGVVGYSSASSGTAYGVFGSASSTTGDEYGVYGLVTDADGIGVFGQNSDPSGTGLVGLGNGLTTYYTLTSGSGAAFTGEQTGLAGFATGTTTTPFPISAGYFSADNTAQSPFAYVAQITDPATNIVAAGGYFDAGGGYGAYAYVGARHTSGTNYKIIGGGTVSTVVKAPDGTLRVLHAIETPEIYFMDLGVSRLRDGKARVDLDPIFAHIIHVDEKRPLRVFVQVMNTFECGTVIVKERTKTYFTVEAERPCNAEFQWMVIANRASEYDASGKLIARYHDVRFELGPDQLNEPAVNRVTITLPGTEKENTQQK